MTALNVCESDKQDCDCVDEIVANARIAQKNFAKNADQKRFDQAALAAAWAVMEPLRNETLAKIAVASTGLGNVADKMAKNHRKTLGVLRDIKEAKTCGVIAHDRDKGITEIARPKGVIGALIPSTNPVATPATKVVNALKCGNAIVLSPSPKGITVCEKLVGYMHEEFEKIGIDKDLVRMIPAPVSKLKSQRLMEVADFLVVTGSQNNVRQAYASGTPAIGVGAGNVAVIIDETANVSDAAQKIASSKTFDNSTSCSSENALVIVDDVFDQAIKTLNEQGGRLLTGEESRQVIDRLFLEGRLNRHMVAQDIDEVINQAGLDAKKLEDAKFLMVEGRGIGPDHPESGEKLSLILTLYRARDFDHARELAHALLEHQGAGHSIGLHSSLNERAILLGESLPTCRVIVNQAHCFATGGAFDNGLPFSLSMGCGSWGGNSIDENFNHKHLMNITKVVRTIPSRTPSLDDIFGDYWKAVRK